MRPPIATIQAFLLTSAGELARTAVDVASLKPGWVLVRVTAAGVCGTDLTEHRRRVARPGAHPDVLIGHEVAGRVVASESEDWAKGTPVVIDPAMFCGSCETCLAGRTSYCPRLTVLGHNFGAGGLADQVAVPASALIAVPESIDPVVAALVEPLSCAHHAAGNVVTADAMDRIVVFGAGAIGLGIALVLRARGHRDITVVEPAPARRAIAAAFGLQVHGRPPRVEVPVAVEASGNVAAFQGAMRATARGGQVVIAAQHVGLLPVDADLAFSKEIQLRWSLGALRADFQAVLDLVAARVLDPAPMAAVVRPEEFTTRTFDEMADGAIAKPVIAWG